MTDLTTSTHATVARQVLSGKKSTLKTLNSKAPLVRIRETFIVCDISGSMCGDKMDNLKIALKKVFRPGIKMLAFSTEVYELEESDIINLESMDRTFMLAALEETWLHNPRHIILLTDGNPDDRKQDILDCATKHKDIPIDTVGLCSAGRRDYDPVFLAQLSLLTGGKFTDVGKPIELTAVIQNLLLEAGSGSESAIQL